MFTETVGALGNVKPPPIEVGNNPATQWPEIPSASTSLWRNARTRPLRRNFSPFLSRIQIWVSDRIKNANIPLHLAGTDLRTKVQHRLLMPLRLLLSPQLEEKRRHDETNCRGATHLGLAAWTEGDHEVQEQFSRLAVMNDDGPLILPEAPQIRQQ